MEKIKEKAKLLVKNLLLQWKSFIEVLNTQYSILYCTAKVKVEDAVLTFGIFEIAGAVFTIIYGGLLIIAMHFSLPNFSFYLKPKEISGKEDHMSDLPENLKGHTFDDSIRYIYNNVMPWLVLPSGIMELVLSVILVVGIQKKKPEYLRAFFIYGVIITPIHFILSDSGLTIASAYGYRHMIPHITYMVLNCIFIAGLVLVHKTYNKYKSNVGTIFIT